MKNKIFVVILTLLVSSFLQWKMEFNFGKSIIESLLTVSAIFFGFYITSFSVFATSKYLSHLYKIEDENDNRKTLLDNLLAEFKFATNFLLISIAYFIFLHILVESEKECSAYYLAHFCLGMIFLNLLHIFQTVSYFIKITRQSAKENW